MGDQSTLSTNDILLHLERMGRIEMLATERIGAIGHAALTDIQLEELTHASYGLTVKESAEKSYVAESTAKTRRKQIFNKWNIPNMAFAVRIGLDWDMLPFAVSEKPLEKPLTGAELEVMVAGSLGLSSSDTATLLSKEQNTVNRQRDSAFEKLSAANMPHAVRRLYEFGILQPLVADLPIVEPEAAALPEAFIAI